MCFISFVCIVYLLHLYLILKFILFQALLKKYIILVLVNDPD